MHAFALAMGSCAGHVWAKVVIANAQKVVTYMRAATQAYSKVLELAINMGIKAARLKTSSSTRFSSIYDCLQSVARMQLPLQALVQQHASVIKSAEVLSLLKEPTFWTNVQSLSNLLAPFAKVIAAIQARQSRLADVTRYWLWLASSIAEASAGLPSGGAVGILVCRGSSWREGALRTIILSAMQCTRRLHHTRG
jgi:hypothetical protein